MAQSNESRRLALAVESLKDQLAAVLAAAEEPYGECLDGMALITETD